MSRSRKSAGRGPDTHNHHLTIHLYNMDRRSFIKSSAVAGLSGMALFGAGCARQEEPAVEAEEELTGSVASIGLQLYTVRSLMQEDFAGTIERVAAIGYKELEFAGYFDHSPADVRTLIDGLGLTAPAVHAGIGSLRSDLDAVIESAAIIGHQYIVCPYLDENERTLDHYKQHAEFFNTVGEACKAAGVQFAYHNHDFEFFETDGVLPYDVLLTETDSALMQMELDLYWIRKAGFDERAYFETHPGRFPLCHVKDMAADGEITSVGSGGIDFGTIFAASEEAGLEHYFVEHDFPDDPMQSITDGYAHVAALRF